MKNSERKENPRKAELIRMSNDMRKKRDLGLKNAKSQEEVLFWASVRINDLIKETYYEKSGTDDFRTFTDWHEAGFKIKRGERGWIIWAQKRSATIPGQSRQDDENIDEYQFFPTCYLFNINQVEPFNVPVCHEEEF